MIAEKELSLFEVEQAFDELKDFLSRVARDGEAMHTVERGLWDRFLSIGLLSLQAFVEAQGNGDVGEALVLPGGRSVKRLDDLHRRRYVSIFGELGFERCVYGTRKTQKIEAVPLDARLELPDGEFSYVLQDWDQSFCVQTPFKQSANSVERILKLSQSVGSLERMSQEMAASVEPFRMSQPIPPEEAEGELMVVAADGKGVPMRRDEGDPRPKDPRHPKKGEKKNKKRMACVGAAYTIDRFPRTPDDIVDEMLHDKTEERRPKPQHKRVRADLTQQWDGEEINAKDIVFGWLAEEAELRNSDQTKPVIFLSDGERALEDNAEEMLPEETILILDIYHALEPLWETSSCFYPEGSEECRQFVETRLRMLLNGKVDYVIRGLRQMKTKHELKGNKAKAIQDVTRYYRNNRHRMQYDEYLAAGYPIGSGAVEGACRNLVKDRMEGAGMRWRPGGAQATLSLRATFLNGDWAPFCEFRIQLETDRLYPYREELRLAKCN